MQGYEREKLRRELDETLLPFRLARKRRGGGAGCNGEGWLKSIRQALGVPVDELARQLGVRRWEIHRLEKSEKSSRIMLASLSRAAKGLGCELVYALVPKEETLEELAAEQRAKHKKALEKKREKREAQRQPWLEEIGWREKFLGAMRTALRREGVRVRPRKTEQGVASQQALFKETVKLAGLRVSESASQRVSKSASQQGGGRRGEGRGGGRLVSGKGILRQLGNFTGQNGVYEDLSRLLLLDCCK